MLFSKTKEYWKGLLTPTVTLVMSVSRNKEFWNELPVGTTKISLVILFGKTEEYWSRRMDCLLKHLESHPTPPTKIKTKQKNNRWLGLTARLLTVAKWREKIAGLLSKSNRQKKRKKKHRMVALTVVTESRKNNNKKQHCLLSLTVLPRRKKVVVVMTTLPGKGEKDRGSWLLLRSYQRGEQKQLLIALTV